MLLHACSRGCAQVRGDHDDSIRARRAFFESGGYQSQRDTVSAEVARALAPLAVPPSARGRSERRTLHVLDAGTGEGAFLGDVASTLSHGVCAAAATARSCMNHTNVQVERSASLKVSY